MNGTSSIITIDLTVYLIAFITLHPLLFIIIHIISIIPFCRIFFI